MQKHVFWRPESMAGGHSWGPVLLGVEYGCTGDPRRAVDLFLSVFAHWGRWKEFLARCPLKYTGNRGSGAAKVFGTVLLSVLSGHWRYAHINAVRGYGLNPGLLFIDGTVSEDVVRQAMMRITETQGLEWLNQQVVWSIAPAF
jgi:hypothetical protein